jgi:hypothetical protein
MRWITERTSVLMDVYKCDARRELGRLRIRHRISQSLIGSQKKLKTRKIAHCTSSATKTIQPTDSADAVCSQ